MRGRSLLGYDQYSSPQRSKVIDQAISTKSIASSNQMVAATTVGPKVFGSLQYQAVFSLQDASRLLGFVVFVFETSEIIKAVGYQPSVVISISDMIDDGNVTFMYNSLQDQGDAITVEMNQNMIDSSPFYCAIDIPFATRTWRLTFMPSDDYLSRYSDDVERWAGLIGCFLFWAFSLVGCCLLSLSFRVMFFINERRTSAEYYKSLKMTCEKLKETNSKTNIKIKASECALDTVESAVVVVDSGGIVIDYNVVFANVFSNVCQVEPLGDGYDINSIFIDEQPLFYTATFLNDFKKGTRALSANGAVFVRIIAKKIDEVYSDSLPSPMSFFVRDEGQPDYVIVISCSHDEQKYRAMLMHEFVLDFINERDPLLREKMFDHFRNISEVVAKLNVIVFILEYKQLHIDQRIAKHVNIMSYLNSNFTAFPAGILDYLNTYSEERLGDEIIFDELYHALILYVVNDAYFDYRMAQ
ncbi:hypothetical protein AKO1_007280 [Acrasis kona]|uniref:CHASE domain-containing protein n=1 Tax=Acrasis kona TaxID=1008807 RepID=A0AAW2YRS9_9EUKA